MNADFLMTKGVSPALLNHHSFERRRRLIGTSRIKWKADHVFRGVTHDM